MSQDDNNHRRTDAALIGNQNDLPDTETYYTVFIQGIFVTSEPMALFWFIRSAPQSHLARRARPV